MKYFIKKDAAHQVVERLDKLEKKLTERISDLHEVKGGMQSRHAFCYYRDLVSEAKYLLRNNATFGPDNEDKEK